MTISIGIILGIVLISAITIISIYNGFIRKRSMVHEAWSGIDIQLKRRYNLIPALIETVKSYAEHEEKIFANVTKSREKCLTGTTDIEKRSAEENQLTKGLRSVFALAENYPDLKANSNFQKFQEDLNEIEEQIQLARRYYNGSTRELNISVDSFPSNIIANIFNFKKEEFFEIEEPQKLMPKVKF